MLGNPDRRGSCQRKATFSCFRYVPWFWGPGRPLVLVPRHPLVLVLVLLSRRPPASVTVEKSWFPLPLASVTLVILPQCKNIVKLSSLFRHFLSYLGLRGLQLLDPSARWARIRSPCRPPLRLQTEIKENKLLPSLFFTPKHSFQAHFFYEFVVYGLGGYTPSPFTDGFRKQVFDTLPNSIRCNELV